MALIKDGWWQDTWWPSRWWQEDYWLEYGAVTGGDSYRYYYGKKKVPEDHKLLFLVKTLLETL